MDELKSAYDRAMERAERVGKLSPEEMRERKEADYAPAGRAIAERYVEHGHEQLFKEEIGKHGGEEGAIVKRAALASLIQAIDLTSYDTAERAMKGVLALAGGGDDQEVNGIVESMAHLFKDFGEELQRKYVSDKESIENDERELLHQLRISGSAVGGINLAASESWGRAYREFSAPFKKRLDGLKQSLVSAAVDNW